MQFRPCQTSMLALDFSALFTLILGFEFMQIDPQLILKLSNLFIFPIDFN
jgi:hypothetical protein